MSTVRRATALSWAFAVTFAIAGLLGFVPNPVLGPESLFVTNSAHNLVHLVTAAGFAAVAWLGARPSVLFMRGFGATYLAVGLLGMVALGAESQGHLLGLIHINRLDNWLHVGLGLGILGTGLALRLDSIPGMKPA